MIRAFHRVGGIQCMSKSLSPFRNRRISFFHGHAVIPPKEGHASLFSPPFYKVGKMILTQLPRSGRGIRTMGTAMYHTALIIHDRKYSQAKCWASRTKLCRRSQAICNEEGKGSGNDRVFPWGPLAGCPDLAGTHSGVMP